MLSLIPPPTAIGRRGKLATHFPHPRDVFVVFDPIPHKYYVKWLARVDDQWEIAVRSATTIVHAPFDHFDADRVITGMMRSTKPWKDTYMNADGTRKTREELKALWRANGDDASSSGTLMHATIENYLNAIPTPRMEKTRPGFSIELLDDDLSGVDCAEIRARTIDIYNATRLETLMRNVRLMIDVPATMEREMSLFLRYHARRPIRPFATEISLFGVLNGHKVVGQADLFELLDVDTANRIIYLAIGDFKRSKAIKTDTSNGFGKGPVACMVNQNSSHYILQCNLYRLIVEAYYSTWTIDGVEYRVVIKEMYLLVLHPDQSDPIRIDVPKVKDDVMFDVIAYDQSPSAPAHISLPKKRSRAEEQQLIDMFNDDQ